jgi:hypothetical protein
MSVAATHGDVITREEGRALLDRAARKWLNMSREQFLEAWDAGQFVDDDRLGVQQVAMLINVGRE